MNFTKLQGTGNDFILVDARNMERDWQKLSRDMCNRHLGIGADGLILVLSSTIADLKMRIFNSDGSEAEVCGNGLRCFAKYAIESKIVTGPNLTVETPLAGIKTIQAFISQGKVNKARVNMGSPHFKAEEIPVITEQTGQGSKDTGITHLLDYSLNVADKVLLLFFVSMGNPHAVTFINTPVAEFPLHEIGPQVENHAIFPQRVNFEIARVLDRGKIEARVWERGAGETLACGSGACAIAVASKLKGYASSPVDIILTGGDLTIDWDGVGEIYLSGPVEQVFIGEWQK